MLCAGERGGGHQTSLRWWPLRACMWPSATIPKPCSSLQTPGKPPSERWQRVAGFSSLLLLLFFLQVQEEKAKQQSRPAVMVPAAAQGEEGPGPFLAF